MGFLGSYKENTLGWMAKSNQAEGRWGAGFADCKRQKYNPTHQAELAVAHIKGSIMGSSLVVEIL